MAGVGIKKGKERRRRVGAHLGKEDFCPSLVEKRSEKSLPLIKGSESCVS